jgi:predicted DsbA family dithiol-disulfide isomerase
VTAMNVTVWTDPSCPWAWQVSKWLRDLQGRDLIRIEWRLFSLEVNAVRESDASAPVSFREAATSHGDALVVLRSVLRERPGAFDDVYAALGERLHEDHREDSRELVREAAAHAGVSDLAELAFETPDLGDEIVREHAQARAESVFGVPTLRIEGSKAAYGPLIARAPEGDDAVELWAHTRFFVERPDFFELKRWPRDVRPGALAS